MTYESVRRPVSRLWLLAFAGIVAGLSGGARADSPLGEGINATNENPTAVFATAETGAGRTPEAVFLTKYGVYELDTAAKAVRIWQRTGKGKELLFPGSATTATPTAVVPKKSASGMRRFGGQNMGKDPGETVPAGTAFKEPVGMDRHPSENKFAVVNKGEWLNQGNNVFCPSVQVYSFTEETETNPATGAVTLTGATVRFENEFRNAFHTKTNTVLKTMTGVVDSSYWSSNLVTTVTTNWIHNSGGVVETNAVEDANATPLITLEDSWVSEYHTQFTTNYVWEYTFTTNANYLSTATDVAFLGDRGLVVSRTRDERATSPSDLVVFDLSDPGKKGALYPVTNLNHAIGRIAVDPRTGDIYASVPYESAVYRIPAPGSGGSPGAWVDAIAETNDLDGVYIQEEVPADTNVVFGAAGRSGSEFGLLSSPGDLCAWYPGSRNELILLVADAANGRIEAFDYAATPLFPFGGGLPDSEGLHLPKAVWGEEGSDAFAVAGGSSDRRVRIFGADLSGVDADSILSLSVDRPAGSVDLLVAGNAAFIDELHTNTVDSVVLLAMESDGGTNFLRFVVPPSRNDREYTLSVAGAGGLIEPVSATATVPAGETEGTFAFRAPDGIVNADGSIPVYRATVTAPSGETDEAWIGILNANPVITRADQRGYYDVLGNFVTTNLVVAATDVEADNTLQYLWFATTNFNWALNNLRWAVDNHDWADTTVTNWVLLGESDPPSLYAEQNTTQNGPVTNEIYLYVTTGREVSIPEALAPGGEAIEDVVSRSELVIVLTVLDKDGGATLLRFGKQYASQYSEWSISAEDAVYRAVFTAITPTNVAFRVTRDPGSGSPLASDTVTLMTAAYLLQPQEDWEELHTFVVGPDFIAGKDHADRSQPIQMTETNLFYHVVQP